MEDNTQKDKPNTSPDLKPDMYLNMNLTGEGVTEMLKCTDGSFCLNETYNKRPQRFKGCNLSR